MLMPSSSMYERKNWLAVLPVLLMLTSGCSSIIDGHTQKAPMIALYQAGNVKDAEQLIAERAESRAGTGDELMWRLEEGNLKFELGNYAGSLKAFEQAEVLVKGYDQRATVSTRDVGAEAGSAMTNPNAIPYRGFCYDRIMLNTVKSLDYFALNNPSDALVELRRLREYQKQLAKRFADELKAEEKEINKGKATSARQAGYQPPANQKSDSLSFGELQKNPEIAAAMNETKLKAAKAYGGLLNPFAVYMSAIGYFYENNYAEALVDLRSLYKMNPANPLFVRDYVTVGKALNEQFPNADLNKVQPWPYSLKKDIVFVIFANGQGPALREVKFQLILPWVGYTGLAFPRYEYFPAPLQSLELNAGGGTLQTMQVADIDAIAADEYSRRLPVMITRIVVSYLVKETASLAATQAAWHENALAGIGVFIATGLYKYMFNTADTRCWETLPKEYQIMHFPIPTDRQVRIMPIPALVGTQPAVVNLKNSTRFAIIYVRSVNGPLQIKVCEF